MQRRADLGRHQRRQGLVHARRRQASGTTSRRISTACRRGARSRRSSRRTSMPATAYVAVDFHLIDNREPCIYKTTDFGETWTKISDDLPTGIRSTTRCRSPRTRTGRACCSPAPATRSTTRWTTAGTGRSSRTGLPHAPVTWIAFQKQLHDVVVSTYGRGLFILHDITPLEQADKAPTDAADASFVYDPRPAYRQPRSGRAEFLYTTKAGSTDPLKVEILDADGAVIRDDRGAARAGLNRSSGTCGTTRRSRSRCARRRPTTRTSGRSRVSRATRRGR